MFIASIHLVYSVNYNLPLRVSGKSLIVIQDAVPDCHDLIVSGKKNKDGT